MEYHCLPGQLLFFTTGKEDWYAGSDDRCCSSHLEIGYTISLGKDISFYPLHPIFARSLSLTCILSSSYIIPELSIKRLFSSFTVFWGNSYSAEVAPGLLRNIFFLITLRWMTWPNTSLTRKVWGSDNQKDSTLLLQPHLPLGRKEDIDQI